jgi:hypothetical protein
MIRLAYSYWIVTVLLRNSFPKTRRAVRAAQKRVKASKAIGGARTWN